MKHVTFVIVFFALARLVFGAPPNPPRAQQSLSDYETVRRSMQFSVGGVGFAGVTARTEIAFRNLLRSPTAAQDCRKLLSEATTAGQLYGLLGLKLLNDPAYETAASRYKLSRSQASVASGCVVSPRAVAEIANYIDSGKLK